MSFGHVDCWVGEVDHFVICGLRGFEGQSKAKNYLHFVNTEKIIAIFKTSIKYFYNKYNFFRRNIYMWNYIYIDKYFFKLNNGFVKNTENYIWL